MSQIGEKVMILVRNGIILLMIINLWGCSKANESTVTLDATGKHPAGWAVATTGGLHPAAYQTNKSACIECHGSALDPQSTGGVSGISCFSASRSGIECHPGGPSSHPVGWSSPDSHGSAAKADAPGLNYCTQCHGTNFTGGTGKSCMTCHTTAPHPTTPWRGTTATGTTHTTTATANASECARCHLNNLRLTVPQTVPAGSTPDCFNSTMCHGVRSGHPAGWLAAGSHGSAAKTTPSASQGFTYCTQCHGTAFAGGIGLSCMTATCHTPAPHPVAANWRSIGTVTHTNTDVNNAGVCTQCHNATLKNLAQPYLARFVPAGSFVAGTAGCFNGTLCHANIIALNNCTVCHGPLSTTVFNSLAGVTAPSDSKVGTHIKHLNASIQATAYSSNIACLECHTVPGSSTISGSHRNGVNDIVFGTLAKTGSLTPTYTAATGVCANTYCHGTTLTGGGSNKAPVWNQANYLATGCATCHGFPPTTASNGAAVHPADNACSGCHTHVNATNNGFTTPVLHIDGKVDVAAGGGSCITCHASIQTGTHGTPRDAVTTEFGLAWGHKKAGRGAVTDADCIVCHLEGDFASQAPSAKHRDGNIDLRDPDGAGETPITTISGGVFTFTKFATSYAAGSRTSTGHTSNTDIANVISQKFCLACHDGTGATNTTARSNNGGTGTAAMPWGGIALGAGYVAVADAIGTQGLVDVRKQFTTTNSSVHPVTGPRNKDFPTAARMADPYKPTGSRGTSGIKSDSVVMNCFDCHNVSGASPLTTRTTAAHGNAVTVRGTTYAANPTLCLACHLTYNVTNTQFHGAGSAWSATGSSHGTGVVGNCHYCHGSNTNATKPARPRPAQDYHGSNSLYGGGMWPTVGSRPYAFIRGWSGTAYHRPFRSSEFTAGSATCGTGACPGGGQVGDGSTRTYTPGGSF